MLRVGHASFSVVFVNHVLLGELQVQVVAPLVVFFENVFVVSKRVVVVVVFVSQVALQTFAVTETQILSRREHYLN